MPSAKELTQAIAYMEWATNPCGRPPLDLTALERFTEERKGCPCKGVDMMGEPDALHRAIGVQGIERDIHASTTFPERLIGYYEGIVDGWLRIVVYGEGPPPPLGLAKPAFMD